MSLNIVAYYKKENKIVEIEGFSNQKKTLSFIDNNELIHVNIEEFDILRRTSLFDMNKIEMKEGDKVLFSLPNIDIKAFIEMEGIIKYDNGAFKVDSIYGEFPIISVNNIKVCGNKKINIKISEEMARLGEIDRKKVESGNYIAIDIWQGEGSTIRKYNLNPKYIWNYSPDGKIYVLIRKEHKVFFEAVKLNKKILLEGWTYNPQELNNINSFLETYTPLGKYTILNQEQKKN